MMVIRAITRDNARGLYEYFRIRRAAVPYHLPVDYETWRQSMFYDLGDDGKPLFDELNTIAYERDNGITGFIQFGHTRFVFGENGGPNESAGYCVIRNLHFIDDEAGATVADALIDRAEAYFAEKNAKDRYAFFHFFGMRCYAGQGKLHQFEFHVERALLRRGYQIEHENVYFSRALNALPRDEDGDITFLHENGGREIRFLLRGRPIGRCELLPLPRNRFCFLRWIHIESEYAHRGLGTRCMIKLFHEHKRQSVVRLDTDTIDDNLPA